MSTAEIPPPDTSTARADAALPPLDPARLEELRTHPDLPVIGPIAGAWSHDLLTDEWTWSEEMFAIHGFAPGDVIPTTELLLWHKHPEDRDRFVAGMRTAAEFGHRFSIYYKIRDARGEVRHVLTVGSGSRCDSVGRVTEVSGYMVDLTEQRRRDLRPAVQEALSEALEHRGDIEMAKGVIMLGYGITPDEAFGVLRAASTSNNIKLKVVAQRLVRELSVHAGDGDPDPRIDDLLRRVTAADYTDR